MVGSEFIDYVSKMKVATYSGVEDFADKFNFIGTVLVLSLCTLIITAKSYLLKPISCYIATEIGGSNLLNYVENYCWVQGTIPLSYSGSMPSNDEEWNKMEDQKILYYQWVPFVLGLQCCLFYLPRLLWQMICYNRTGTDLENIITKSMDALHSAEKSRQECITNIAATVENLLFQQQKKASFKPSSMFSRKKTMQFENSNMLDDSSVSSTHRKSALRSLPLLSQRRGTYIVAAYIFIKVLYLINAIGQIFMMQAFLGFKHEQSAFGFHVLSNMIQGHDWQMTQIFPRVGFCFAQMKILGVRTNGVTAQCALPTNMLNEKIYVFLWWWIFLAAVLTSISLLMWLVRFCSRSHEADYIIKYIQLADEVVPYDERDAYDFATLFLRRDGMFLMRMVRMNAGDVVAAAVVNSLWDRYLQRRKEKTHNPMSNYKIPAVGWVGDLEKNMDGAGDTTLRKRADVDAGKESMYPSMHPSDDPMKTRTVV